MPAPDLNLTFKGLSLTVIVTLIVQTFVLGWTMSSYNSRIVNLENTAATLPVINERLMKLELHQAVLDTKLIPGGK